MNETKGSFGNFDMFEIELILLDLFEIECFNLALLQTNRVVCLIQSKNVNLS